MPSTEKWLDLFATGGLQLKHVTTHHPGPPWGGHLPNDRGENRPPPVSVPPDIVLPNTDTMGTTPKSTPGDHPKFQQPAGSLPTSAGRKPSACMAALPQPFPFSLPCPGAAEMMEYLGTSPLQSRVALSTPAKNMVGKVWTDTSEMTPPKKSRSHSMENHLNGWENTQNIGMVKGRSRTSQA